MVTDKKGLQVSFGWLFGIIVGIFILVLAIYGVTKLVNTGGQATSAKTGKEIGALLNPLETGFEEGKVTLMTMPVETRIANDCDDYGNFGRQTIQLSQKSFNKWTETGAGIGFSNKYIFSEGIIEGKNFYIFSKPFDFPFKVADLMYMTSADKNYCFLIDPNEESTEDIYDEISYLNQANIFLEDCPDESIKVCFDFGADCDIEVKVGMSYVQKRGEMLYYETDALMYAAIFSDKNVYECQVQRLMKRLEKLARIYDDKSTIISEVGCFPEVNLLALSSVAGSIQSSFELEFAANVAEDARRENDRADCMLW